MRRVIVIIVLLMSFLGGSFAQKDKPINLDGYVRVPNSPYNVLKTDSSKFLRYDGFNIVDIRKATPIQLKRVKERERIVKLQEDRFWGLTMLSGRYPFPRQSLALRFEQNTGAKVYEGLNWKWGNLSRNTIIIDGKSDVEVIDGLIMPQNAKDYRYRIIQNDNKELLGWTTPSTFKKTADGSASYCYLGNIKYQKDQFILIEVYNVKNYKDRDAIIIDWRETRPLAFWITMDYRKKLFGNSILSASLGNDGKWAKQNFRVTDTQTDVRFRLGDSLIRLGFRPQNLLSRSNYQINLKRIKEGKEELIDLGETNGIYFLYKEYWNKPGRYEITITPKMSSVGGKEIKYLKEKAVTYKFTVLPELNPKLEFSRKELFFLGGIVLFLLGLIIYFVRKNGNRKLQKAQQQKEQSKLQLNSIRSQLNPHFMFNALAGIQNLMNTHKIDEANRYLGKFARLTRNVLDGDELISLAEEKTLLEDYIQMEQLRFGFTYEITIDKNLNLDNVEIPTMLLQPFVENAVKHGISENGVEGKINVSFSKENQNLILKVSDNGKGFETNRNYAGLGLQLSKNRISLLNTIYNETSFLLDMKSSENGSEITIMLNQWL